MSNQQSARPFAKWRNDARCDPRALLDLARDFGATDEEITALRRRIFWHTWVTTPVLTAGVICWAIVIARLTAYLK
ncbi:hypothetical protein [uncultured Thiodictyon sp.]|uniref:hypothetical protein n=1 Tax=uncultured Thiodictyon sp. TaxID=1846217 RepID=UPI0025DB546D|nr:hypothetical protein [uncultured Thiodictyon sp.]